MRGRIERHSFVGSLVLTHSHTHMASPTAPSTTTTTTTTDDDTSTTRTTPAQLFAQGDSRIGTLHQDFGDPNQDNYFMLDVPPIFMCGVFDGHGTWLRHAPHGHWRHHEARSMTVCDAVEQAIRERTSPTCCVALATMDSRRRSRSYRPRRPSSRPSYDITLRSRSRRP